MKTIIHKHLQTSKNQRKGATCVVWGGRNRNNFTLTPFIYKEKESAMPRQARLDAPGTLHHVIIRGIEKRRIVDDQKDQANFVIRMGKIASDTGTNH